MDVTEGQVVAAVSRLASELDRVREERAGLLVMNALWGGLLCDLADALDAADSNGGELVVAEELRYAIRSVRDELWSVAIDGATAGDFEEGARS